MTNHSLGPMFLFVAVCASAGFGGDTAKKPAQSAATPAQTAKTSQAVQTVVVSGCLKAADKMGQPIDQTRDTQASSFVLSGVAPAPTSARDASGRATGGAANALLYRVAGLSASELRTHIGAQVELTGTIEPPRTAGTGTDTGRQQEPSAPGTTGSSSTSGSTGTADTLTGRTAVREGETALDALPSVRASRIRVIAPQCAKPAS